MSDWLGYMSLIDPELRAGAAEIEAAIKNVKWTDEGLAAVREMMDSVNSPEPLPDVSLEKFQVPVTGGNPDVVVHVINAREDDARPGIFHTHGGGMIAGKAETSVPRLQTLARDEGWVIVTVDYRLSPETTYEGIIEDHYAGLLWMHQNASKLGINPDKIAVMGESAGGGNAARLALTARDRKVVPLAAQILVYPMLDDRTGSTAPVPEHLGVVAWTPEANRFGWKSFLGMEPGGTNVPVEAVPARQSDLSRLPPTFIGVGDLDLFILENVDYARRLIEAGVPTKLFVAPGAYHAFDYYAPGSQIAQEFISAQLNTLRRAFV